MKATKALTAALLLLPALALAQKQPKPRDIKPGFNLFSKEQDVQMGKEYAAQVEREMPVVNDPRINAYLQNLGQRLAKSASAGGYPYTFKVVNEPSINAFALPGGPTFTHTGLISAADNDSQVAAVLAHEVSHVALRHGTNQASKAQLMQLPAVLGGAMLGNSGGITGALAQLGIGLGANSVLLKMGRNAERDADLLGTRIMAEAGYNPVEMARFFEKLQAEHGKTGKLQEFFASHPNPENRVKSVQQEILLLPQRSYDAESGQIGEIKQIIKGLPAPPKRPQQQQGGQGGQGGGQGGPQPQGNPNDYTQGRPANGMTEFKSQQVAFAHPANWQVLGQQGGNEVTLAAPQGLFANGAIGYGAIAGLQQSQGRPNLQQDTQRLVQAFRQRDPNLQVGNSKAFRLGSGPAAIATMMQGPSPYQGAKESVVLVSVEHPQGLFYMLLIAPDRDMSFAQPVFDQMIDSIRIPR